MHSRLPCSTPNISSAASTLTSSDHPTWFSKEFWCARCTQLNTFRAFSSLLSASLHVPKKDSETGNMGVLSRQSRVKQKLGSLAEKNSPQAQRKRSGRSIQTCIHVQLAEACSVACVELAHQAGASVREDAYRIPLTWHTGLDTGCCTCTTWS